MGRHRFDEALAVVAVGQRRESLEIARARLRRLEANRASLSVAEILEAEGQVRECGRLLRAEEDALSRARAARERAEADLRVATRRVGI